ncbi:Aste57867_18387 [Aphanomyces stellatus]|uniref:peptidylprolyl isomerase n=1 Tax=Aphanomyces stellatus TaxID=120398 RepID=A0A485LDP2_9STRA|nr:hypothetical protein As57867_018325 [Aphanomyces stellatus]VFT95123.1 Aste57867_18387 [Aphanomyces stellatus]
MRIPTACPFKILTILGAELMSAAPYGEAYTVSKMLDTINETMGDAGKVQLKRNVGNGVALDTSEKEIAFLDTQAKIKSSTERVSLMDRAEKREWIAHHRAKGNDLFKDGRYKEASDVYLEALAGLELDGLDRDQVQREIQNPITCNIVACMLKLEQWEKAVKMTSLVLDSESAHVKALMQRAKAYMKLEDFEKSRADANKVVAVAPDEAGAKPLLDVIRRAELHSKRQTQEKKSFEKNMMKNMGKLYGDKKTPEAGPLQAATTGWLPPHAVQSVFRVVAWVLGWCFGKRKQA